MQHFVRFIILSFISTLLVLTSCNHKSNLANEPRHSVLVVHSWDSVGEEGAFFVQHVKEQFEKHELNVEVHHIYANMAHNLVDAFHFYNWQAYKDSISKWKPEVVLLNDDPAMDWVMTYCIDDSLFTSTPTVFAGVNALMRDSLHNFPLMTGFEDRIDLSRNIELYMKLTNKQIVNMELDFSDYDMRLRSLFRDLVSDTTRFVDNSDYHLQPMSEEAVRKSYPGKIIINTVSCAMPFRNVGVEDDSTVWKDRIQNIYNRASNIRHLQVKYDIFSNTLIDRSQQPQFTCIREQFNDPTHVRFLGGYFVSTETQIDDQVEYAVRIINGEAPKSLPISVHASGYYMDWNAMKLFTPQLSYFTHSQQFEIVNAPYHLTYPLGFSIQVLALLFAVIAIIYGIVSSLNKWKRKEQKELVEQLVYEERVHDLVFSNTKDTLWELRDGVFTFSEQFAEYFNLPSNRMTMEQLKTCVHEESLRSYEVLTNFRKQRGKKVIRLRLTADGGKNWHWTEATYTVTDDAARNGELHGLLMNIDRKKEIEAQLEEAQILASQVALKENFLANISHDLRTPLGAVTGFSTLLATPGMSFEPGEREEYREIIHQNTDMILDMIDSVMKKAQVETGDLEILQKAVSVQTLINECFNTNRIIAPTHLTFALETDEPDCTVNIDATRTKQVVNNFLSNAFKFTTEGSVTLGWKHLDEEQVEVYVNDTGIGVDKDKQSSLFERYVKVNETDRGTGLGLNISKTIMEKQNGTIGVESEPGKGSKFFFRLNKIVQCLLLVLTMAFGMASMSSCTTEMRRPKQDAKVLIIHGYGKTDKAYKGFNEDVMSSLIKQGINPTFHHLYLNLDDPRAEKADLLVRDIDSLTATGWVADIIITEGDRTANVLLNFAEAGLVKNFDNTPVVMGGLHHPEWEMIRKHKKVVAINDPIDYCTNINLAAELTGKHIVAIELDYFHQDSLIREELKQAIARPPYVDNTDFHVKSSKQDKYTKEWKDSIMVMCFSTESPEKNGEYGMDLETAYNYMNMIYTHAWRYPCVSVKKDLYSSSIVDKTEHPQFTAVKAGFANGEGRYLCGYFASYKTVATDLGTTAAKILLGTDPASIVSLTHEKRYYMDYKAMTALGYEYKDYCDRFEIVGAPIEQTMPVLYYGSWVAIALVFMGALFAILLVVQSWNNRSAQRILDGVKRRAELRTLALHGADSRSVRSEENLKDIISHIHPDRSADIPLMMQAIDIAGTHTYDIYADIDGNGNYRWWQLRFAVQFNHEEEKRADGILINIDEAMKHEEELRLAMRLAEEARQKEDFLTTISHEIRTPLNAVVGFSDLMVSMPEGSFSDAELAEYSKYIKTNNATLTTMIEDILMFSRIESGRIKYISEVFDVSQLLSEIQGEWAELIPDGIQLQMTNFVRFTYVNADRARVKYIINQYISNAVKFTKFGIILLGVSVHFNKNMVEFFVIDTGCGIPFEKQQLSFNLFWKDNEFIPGLGLGLNVAQKLADGMGLKLEVDSKEGMGSKFSVFAPAIVKRPGPPSGMPGGPMGGPMGGPGGAMPEGMPPEAAGMPPMGGAPMPPMGGAPMPPMGGAPMGGAGSPVPPEGMPPQGCPPFGMPNA